MIKTQNYKNQVNELWEDYKNRINKIKQNYEKLGYKSNFTILDSDDTLTVIKKIIKDMDLDVESMIGVLVYSSSKFKELVQKQSDLIKNEVRAITFTLVEGNTSVCVPESEAIENEYTKKWKIEDEEIMISIVKK